MSNWIDVNERLPDNDHSVIVLIECLGYQNDECFCVCEAFFLKNVHDINRWIFNSKPVYPEIVAVVAWMPIPDWRI